MKVTQWFSGDVNPVRKGVYQRDYSKDPSQGLLKIVFCYWNGKHWGFFGHTIKEARVWRHDRSLCAVPWRGLAVKPKTQTKGK